MASAKILLERNWLLAGLMIVSIGCGPPKPATIQTEAVTGLVTLDGQPAPEATVTFVPVQEGVGASATGMTDASGKYELTAVGAGIGAKPGAGTLPGEYFVGVRKVILPELPDTDEAAEAPSSRERPKDVQVTHVVPQRFNDPRNSGIKVTVKSGTNDIPIPLTSK